MDSAPVDSRFGKLPAVGLGAERRLPAGARAARRHDRRPALPRVGAAHRATPTSRRCCPGNHGVPSVQWDFTAHTGDRHLRLRDHGNETDRRADAAVRARTCAGRHRARRRGAPVIAPHARSRSWRRRMPDGLLYNEMDAATLTPDRRAAVGQLGVRLRRRLHLLPGTGEARYRDAVRRVLRNAAEVSQLRVGAAPEAELPLGSFDGYADTHRERDLSGRTASPCPEALDWIESEMQVMLAHAAAGRPHRGLVRRRELQSHGAALRVHEEPRRAARALGTRGARRRRARTASACASSLDDASAAPHPFRLRAPPPRR